MTADQLRYELKKVANPEKAAILSRFFKTGKGDYGEGDKFLGVVVPAQRKIVRQYFAAPGGTSVRLALSVAGELLQGEFHEERFIALLILVEQYKRGGDGDKELVFRFYMKHLGRVNNWDLVDVSAPNIVGDYLLTRDSLLLFKLAKSKNMWERRVAMLATFAFIRNGRFAETMALAELLLIQEKDPQDLMHKATGWMLREVGKRDRQTLENFLAPFAALVPRTALRYAIEKFPEADRRQYLTRGRTSKSLRD